MVVSCNRFNNLPECRKHRLNLFDQPELHSSTTQVVFGSYGLEINIAFEKIGKIAEAEFKGNDQHTVGNGSQIVSVQTDTDLT